MSDEEGSQGSQEPQGNEQGCHSGLGQGSTGQGQSGKIQKQEKGHKMGEMKVMRKMKASQGR